jgi:hypothetical protein
MILLIAPYQERLGIVVVNASSSGPEAACIGSLQRDKEVNTRVKDVFQCRMNTLLAISQTSMAMLIEHLLLQKQLHYSYHIVAHILLNVHHSERYLKQRDVDFNIISNLFSFTKSHFLEY